MIKIKHFGFMNDCPPLVMKPIGAAAAAKRSTAQQSQEVLQKLSNRFMSLTASDCKEPTLLASTTAQLKFNYKPSLNGYYKEY
jgi:hypothetical protein